jgi:hypothetical protein
MTKKKSPIKRTGLCRVETTYCEETAMSGRVVYAFDVGGRDNFGWTRREPSNPEDTVGSDDIATMVSRIAFDARNGMSIALGVEAPCFIPVPWNAENLNQQRNGENGYPFAAQAGAIAAIIGLHQTAWVLRRLHAEFGETHVFTTDWSLWPGSSRPILLLWEAFVCNHAHSDEHVRDAATAVHEFCKNERRLAEINAVTCFPRICLAHAAALWSGWSSDVSGLHNAMLVVRPNKVWRGSIQPA